MYHLAPGELVAMAHKLNCQTIAFNINGPAISLPSLLEMAAETKAAGSDRGNKSMFMHMVVGADICVECFARNLYNQGTMAVIHRQDKA